MQIKDLMTAPAVSVRSDETADVAARLMGGHNIGAVPVVDGKGRVVGMLTDRDLVVRCMAPGLDPRTAAVSQVMTPGPMTAEAGEDASAVSARMGREQVRRAPVVEDGVLTGVVSLADLARTDGKGAALALRQISENISRR